MGRCSDADLQLSATHQLKIKDHRHVGSPHRDRVPHYSPAFVVIRCSYPQMDGQVELICVTDYISKISEKKTNMLIYDTLTQVLTSQYDFQVPVTKKNILKSINANQLTTKKTNTVGYIKLSLLHTELSKQLVTVT